MREVDFELKAWNRTAQAEFVAEDTLPSLESARCLIERLLQAECSAPSIHPSCRNGAAWVHISSAESGRAGFRTTNTTNHSRALGCCDARHRNDGADKETAEPSPRHRQIR
jgi:hypothetical protein